MADHIGVKKKGGIKKMEEEMDKKMEKQTECVVQKGEGEGQ